MATLSSTSERLAAVRARIAAAAARAGRSIDGVTLIAVSKLQSAAAIAALADLGQRDFGENYLQEGLQKISVLRERDLVWHFIGQLQSNKTRAVAENFAWVHTVDRARIAARLDEQRPFHAPPLSVCVQVKLGGEATKGGVTTAALRGLFETARTRHPQMDTLSMGMSGDLEAAILEGATHVRIGTALFGERLQSTP
jgi:pyridoxal phosphate enzyme (YggS family)